MTKIGRGRVPVHAGAAGRRQRDQDEIVASQDSLSATKDDGVALTRG